MNRQLTIERAEEYLLSLARSDAEEARILWSMDVIEGAKRFQRGAVAVDYGPPPALITRLAGIELSWQSDEVGDSNEKHKQ
uniref:Uncharacterized protein n=1 Tax=viral metagenome TaxID=1070528 RepID=A0A6M3JLF6_9ZZZZ